MMTFPPDAERAAGVAPPAGRPGQEERLLYLGRFAPHQNLERLSLRSREAGSRGAAERFLLVGGWGDETERMRAWVRRGY